MIKPKIVQRGGAFYIESPYWSGLLNGPYSTQEKAHAAAERITVLGVRAEATRPSDPDPEPVEAAPDPVDVPDTDVDPGTDADPTQQTAGFPC